MKKGSNGLILSLGEFKFTLLTNIESISIEHNSSVEFKDRINNFALPVKAKQWSKTVSFSGSTLPVRVGQKALEPLVSMLKSGKAYTITTSRCEYWGKYIILSLSEGRKSFAANGLFLTQTFSISLRHLGE